MWVVPWRSIAGCTRSVELTLEDYDAIRAHPTHFIVSSGHQLAGIERVVEAYDRFLVVEKAADTRGIAFSIRSESE